MCDRHRPCSAVIILDQARLLRQVVQGGVNRPDWAAQAMPRLGSEGCPTVTAPADPAARSSALYLKNPAMAAILVKVTRG